MLITKNNRSNRSNSWGFQSNQWCYSCAIGTALFPGVGTIAGFVIGAAIGAVVDFAINVDWTGDGLSLMDTIKGGIYSLMCPVKG